MNIINVENITKVYTERELFSKASFYVQEREKIGIVGINGTGKTTTMSLRKGVFDGTANNWDSSTVKTYAPTTVSSNNGEFSIKVKFDEKIYQYFIVLDYSAGTARIETAAMPKGRENGRILPESIKTIFTEEFVKRFVFDGEQAEKSMDSKFDEAEQTIKYLYRLDKLDDILSANQKILSEIQNTEGEGRNGSDSALSNLRTRRDEVEHTIRTLKFKADNYKKRIEEYEVEKAEKIAQRNEIDKKYKEYLGKSGKRGEKVRFERLFIYKIFNEVFDISYLTRFFRVEIPEERGYKLWFDKIETNKFDYIGKKIDKKFIPVDYEKRNK